MPFVPLAEYNSTELSAALDGPILLSSGAFGLFVSLRGKDGGAMPSSSELHWSRDVPPRMRLEPVLVFLRREGSVLYLGEASFVRAGSPRRDGFKIAFRFAEALPETAWQELVATANAPAPPAPGEAILALTEASTADERVNAMEVFVDRWYGPIPSDGRTAALPSGGTFDLLPDSLRRLHRLAARRALFGQNRLTPPERLAVVDHKLVFYTENQGVCEWAIDPTTEDPRVFVRGNATGDPWVEEAPTLSGFLVQVVIYEAVLCAASFSAANDAVSTAELRRLKRNVPPIQLPPWSSTKTQFFCNGGIVGFAYPNGNAFQVELAAQSREPFEAIEGLLEYWPEIGF